MDLHARSSTSPRIKAPADGRKLSIIGEARASLVDLEMTRVVDGDLVKVLSWYDNEWGYANQLVRHATAMLSSAAEAG